MKPVHFVKLNTLRFLVMISAATLLIWGLFFGPEQAVSWAAPEQNPLLQTIPPRPPTPEPEPTELAPVAPAPNQPSDKGGKNEQDNRDDGFAAPVQPTAQMDELPPTQASPALEESGADSQENRHPLPSTPAAEEKTGAEGGPASPAIDPAGSAISPLLSNPDEVAAPQAGEQLQPILPVPIAKPNLHAPVDGAGSLLWLYALVLGVILMVMGMWVVKRA